MRRVDKGHNGRRGRKRRDQERRRATKKREREQAIRSELEERARLIKQIKPWMLEICSRSECGFVVNRDRPEHEMRHGAMFCKGGQVTEYYLNHRTRTVVHADVLPWESLHASYLRRIKRGKWKPLWPKNILQLIADKL